MAARSIIRRLFLEPKSHYSLSKAAKLLEMKEEELQGWMAAGEIEAVEVDGKEVIPWAEVVSFAIDLWSQEEIEAALGAEVAEAIPELLRLTELEVRIPRIELLALEHVAMRDGRAVDAVLSRELLGFVSAEAEWLNREIPGFIEALAWPEASYALKSSGARSI
ncbi:MAG TPA: hypothetical protein VGR95_15195 [Thermoanaerobaculia bacterium]|jgi:hypothetical protein|nr:hypothetical protein [Thermoanaerobaculia bacterium]